MKKILFASILIIVMYSCKKEETKPENTVNNNTTAPPVIGESYITINGDGFKDYKIILSDSGTQSAFNIGYIHNDTLEILVHPPDSNQAGFDFSVYPAKIGQFSISDTSDGVNEPSLLLHFSESWAGPIHSYDQGVLSGTINGLKDISITFNGSIFSVYGHEVYNANTDEYETIYDTSRVTIQGELFPYKPYYSE